MNAETDIQRKVMAALKALRVPAWRVNATSRSYRMAVNPGMSDIIAILPGGRFLGLEVKVPGARVSDAQIDFGGEVEKAGGVYLVVTSADDFLRWFKTYGRASAPDYHLTAGAPRT